MAQEEADAYVEAWAQRREALIKESRGAWVAQKQPRNQTDLQVCPAGVTHMIRA